MELFERTFSDILNYTGQKKGHSWSVDESAGKWPGGGGRNVVLSDETAVELGNPQMASASVLLWAENPGHVRDGKITLIGPDLQASQGKSLPFGKVVLVGVKGFNEENTYERYKEMEAVRYSLDLRGYMMRAVSQYQREWSRVSFEALQNGFSFAVLGCALRSEYLKKDYVRSVEIIFVTSNSEDVHALREITKNVSRTINAMDKMLSEIDSDCDECEYNDVCDEVGVLKNMRKRRDEKRGYANG